MSKNINGFKFCYSVPDGKYYFKSHFQLLIDCYFFVHENFCYCFYPNGTKAYMISNDTYYHNSEFRKHLSALLKNEPIGDVELTYESLISNITEYNVY